MQWMAEEDCLRVGIVLCVGQGTPKIENEVPQERFHTA